jgi:ABC-2 type transport system ATP-binding protein
MNVHAIELNELTRTYGGRVAVDRLNLKVAPGEVFGFVGPNGAGKTTTLRMIAGLLPPTHGEVLIGERSVRREPQAVRRQIGYMPDFFGVYPELLVWEYLDFFAACYHIPESKRPDLIAGLLELVDLSHREHDPVDRLSRGMKQRLSLARALIHDPAVLLLDEPASGLDPRARVEIRELLVELARMGKTIFFSTHILADVAEICTQVGIIEAGTLVAVGSLDELRVLVMPRRRLELTLLHDPEAAETVLKGIEGISGLEHLPTANGDRPRLAFEFSGDDDAIAGLLGRLVQAGLPVLNFYEDRRDLEEVFLRATRGVVS